jgi:hypothetical protein
MQITLEWNSPIQLTRYGEIILDDRALPQEIPAKPGVYFFSRKHGIEYIPFYIGETLNIRARLKSHLRWRDIADVLRGIAGPDHRIKQGTRYFHYGVFRGRQGQDPKTCLSIVQRHMIREAVEEEIPILNKNLKKFKSHAIRFDGSRTGRGWFEKHSIAEE